MSKLTTEGRKHIAPKNFALPGGRYPIHDASHARNALARVSQFGSSAEKAKVRAAVHRKYPGIGQSSGGYAPNPGYEGSPADIRKDKREAAKRGWTQAQWERSAADKRMDKAKGGYAPRSDASEMSRMRKAQSAIKQTERIHTTHMDRDDPKDMREYRLLGRAQKNLSRLIGAERTEESKGGYVPNYAASHPRMHALTMASATHLQNAGHMPKMMANRIRANARMGMAQMKQMRPMAPPSFGALAPQPVGEE